MALRAKKPKEIENRLKLFLFGDYGVGKTTAAISFPKTYVIDAEKGASNKSYVDLMNKNKSEIFQSSDPEEITQELRALISEKHDFHTVVLDPVTVIESNLVDYLSLKYPKEGDRRVWADRDRILKRMTNILLKLNMNVIVTAHGKVDYGDNFVKLGTTFDAWKRWPFLFDVVIELRRQGNERIGVVRKTRVENFKDGENFKWSYEEFQKRYGNTIEKESIPMEMATAEQIEEIKKLIGVLNIAEDIVIKWKTKALADDWDEFSKELIQKCIDYCHKLIKG